jgi:hypothetical protein
VSYDRKLDISEEDEEDRTERERLATTLKLMGISTEVDPNLLTPQLLESNPLNQTGAKSAGAFSRFSAFFGRPTTATTSSDDVRTVGNSSVPETTSKPAASGEVGIERQRSGAESQDSIAESQAHLAEIMEESRRTRAKRRTLSTSQAENISETLSALHHRRTVGGDASLSTLWSLGSNDQDP